MSSRRLPLLHVACVFAALSLVAFFAPGCSTADATARESAGSLNRASFPPVADVYLRRCGSLECHGTPYRNFRLYGLYGQRLNAADRPDQPVTSVAEYDANYQAFLGLEPTVLREVIAGGGVDATRLTVVRKGRGDEAHKGGMPIAPGDAADRCILSWIRNAPDAAACTAAVKSP